MNVRKRGLPALALAALVAGFGPLSVRDAQAQANQAPATGEMHHAAGGQFHPGRHIEGRIAFLKAELKITDAQAPQFDKLAAAMRDNAKEMDQVMGQVRANRDQPQSAVQRLETRARLAELRVQASQRFLAAFKPLYESLSADQKKSADELLAPHHHRL